jgi:hypothetical protein
MVFGPINRLLQNKKLQTQKENLYKELSGLAPKKKATYRTSQNEGLYTPGGLYFGRKMIFIYPPPRGLYFGPKMIFIPPPSENDIFPPSRDMSFFDSHRGLFA